MCITVPAVSYGWDAAGGLTDIVFPQATGSVDRYSYDITGALTGIAMLDNSTVTASLDYGHDANGAVANTTAVELPGLPRTAVQGFEARGASRGFFDLGGRTFSVATVILNDDAGQSPSTCR